MSERLQNWAVTQRVVVIPFRRFGRTWPRGFPETSVRNYHYMLRNSPEERRSHLLRGGSLKSRLIDFLPKYTFHIGYVKCARSNMKFLHRRHTCKCSCSWYVAVHICTARAPIVHCLLNVKILKTSPCYFTPYKKYYPHMIRISLRSITVHHFRALREVALVSPNLTGSPTRPPF
jgi:hypothetical protein